MRRGWMLALVGLVAMGSAGCRSGNFGLRPAGTVEKQRFTATVFDPYTDVDAGPEVVGGRPRDFQEPLPESDRSRLFQKIWLPFR
ncbi:MAG: membrane or secreted protein [Planctomycetes bacterium]|nr:membrane or secreted protein [Planctomycetota bacterium]